MDKEKVVRNRYFDRIATINPVLHTQQLYNQIAGSSLADYQDYRQQVSAFQQQWRGFIYPFQLAEKPLDAAAFQRFPVFTLHREPLHTGALLSGCALLYALILLFAVGGYFLFHRNTQP